MKPEFYAGVDLGSSAIKVVLVDSAGAIRKRFLRDTSLRLDHDIEMIFEDVDDFCGNGAGLAAIVSTGYGRNKLTRSSEARAEIICHARGVFHTQAGPCTIIDIGGQDNKVIHLDDEGRVVSFKMNTKCAAGTGSFLEEIAAKAKLPLEKLNALAEASESTASINSFCTVFAMTEVLKRIISGEKLEDIIRGVFNSVAKRVQELCGSSAEAIVLTGGVVAQNPLLPELISQALERPVQVCEQARYSAALGAALMSLESRSEAPK